MGSEITEITRERWEKQVRVWDQLCSYVVLPEISSQGLESLETWSTWSQRTESQRTRRGVGTRDRGLGLGAKTDKLGETLGERWRLWRQDQRQWRHSEMIEARLETMEALRDNGDTLGAKGHLPSGYC